MKSTVVVVRDVNLGNDSISVSYSVTNCFSEFLDYLRYALNRQSEGIYPDNPHCVYFGICVDGVSFVLCCRYDESANLYVFDVINPSLLDVSIYSVEEYKHLGNLFLSAAHIYNDIVSRLVSPSFYIRGINVVNRCFLKLDYKPLCYANKSLSSTISLSGFARAAAGFNDNDK